MGRGVIKAACPDREPLAIRVDFKKATLIKSFATQTIHSLFVIVFCLSGSQEVDKKKNMKRRRLIS